MTRALYRFREHWIAPDCKPDAEPWTFAMECAVCEQSSSTSEETDRAQEWAAGHLKANPEHFTYRERVTRPYRAEPGPWQ